MNSKLKLVIYLGLFCFLSFATASKGLAEDDFGLPDTVYKKPEVSHIKESAEFQAINSYLTSLEPLTIDNAIVVPHLKSAIQTIESGGENKGVGHEDLGILLENDRQVTLSILRNFVSASKSCEQSELNFLTMVTEQQTFEGQFLNKYAKNLLEKCWSFNLSALSQRIDRAIGKMSSALFDFLAELGTQVFNRRQRAQRNNAGTLTISDQTPPNNPVELLKQLKQVTFDAPGQLRLVALSVNGMFGLRLTDGMFGTNRIAKTPKKEELNKLNAFFKDSLIVPCEQLIDRMKGAFSLLMDYNHSFASRQTQKIKLESMRASDPTLDYHLEIYRICRQSKANSSALWSLLSKMR